VRTVQPGCGRGMGKQLSIFDRALQHKASRTLAEVGDGLFPLNDSTAFGTHSLSSENTLLEYRRRGCNPVSRLRLSIDGGWSTHLPGTERHRPSDCNEDLVVDDRYVLHHGETFDIGTLSRFTKSVRGRMEAAVEEWELTDRLSIYDRGRWTSFEN